MIHTGFCITIGVQNSHRTAKRDGRAAAVTHRLYFRVRFRIAFYGYNLLRIQNSAGHTGRNHGSLNLISCAARLRLVLRRSSPAPS